MPVVSFAESRVSRFGAEHFSERLDGIFRPWLHPYESFQEIERPLPPIHQKPFPRALFYTEDMTVQRVPKPNNSPDTLNETDGRTL